MYGNYEEQRLLQMIIIFWCEWEHFLIMIVNRSILTIYRTESNGYYPDSQLRFFESSNDKFEPIIWLSSYSQHLTEIAKKNLRKNDFE